MGGKSVSLAARAFLRLILKISLATSAVGCTTSSIPRSFNCLFLPLTFCLLAGGAFSIFYRHLSFKFPHIKSDLFNYPVMSAAVSSSGAPGAGPFQQQGGTRKVKKVVKTTKSGKGGDGGEVTTTTEMTTTSSSMSNVTNGGLSNGREYEENRCFSRKS